MVGETAAAGTAAAVGPTAADGVRDAAIRDDGRDQDRDDGRDRDHGDQDAPQRDDPRKGRIVTMSGDLQDALQTLTTNVAMLQVTLTNLVASIQEIKAMLPSYVRQDVFEAEMAGLKARQQSADLARTTFVSLDTYQNHITQANERFEDVQKRLERAPDIMRQNAALLVAVFSFLVALLGSIASHISLH